MAIYQVIFWLAVVLLCAGIGVGGLYWFHVRENEGSPAPEWKDRQPPHRSGAQ